MSNKKIAAYLSSLNLLAVIFIAVADDIFRRNINSVQLLLAEGAKIQKLTATFFSLTVQTDLGPLTFRNEAPIIALIVCTVNIILLLVMLKRRNQPDGSSALTTNQK